MTLNELGQFLRDRCDHTNDEIIRWFEGEPRYGFTRNKISGEINYDTEENIHGNRETKRDCEAHIKAVNGVKRIEDPSVCQENRIILLEALNTLNKKSNSL